MGTAVNGAAMGTAMCTAMGTAMGEAVAGRDVHLGHGGAKLLKS